MSAETPEPCHLYHFTMPHPPNGHNSPSNGLLCLEQANTLECQGGTITDLVWHRDFSGTCFPLKLRMI